MLVAIVFGALVLVPGVYARWSSRHLLRHLEDPLLPDRLVEHFRRLGSVAGIVIGLGAVFFGAFLPALLVLAWVSVLAGGFRARKAVFDESWDFPSYLVHTLRFWLGLVGSFALIASIPWAMALSGDGVLAVGMALGAAAWLWVLSGPVVFRRLVRARPIDGPEAEALLPLFSRILEKAKCGVPALFVAEARGGSWVNAFALPAARRPGVLFTRGILDALTHEETAAIFAHEVAHLEHFQPRKVLLGRALALVLVVLPVFLWAGPLSDFLRGWEWIWPLAFVIAFAARAVKSRGHEAESDRRALDLSANPDALVSALTKLHSLNRLSRRWDVAYESLSTHPSLARRIRAIRAVSGKRVPGALEASFRAADGSDRAVLFDSSRIHWLRELPEDGKDLLARSGSRQSHRYEDLLELRLRGGNELVMKGKAGETGRMAVRAEDVAAIEDLLDRVDGLLSDAPAAAAPTGRIWSLVLGLLALIPPVSWVVAALAATALARPSFATLIALGASGLASAVAIRDPSRPWWLSCCIALAGVACLAVAARRRGVPRSRSEALLATLVPLALVILSGFGAAAAFVSSLPAMHASLWASESPSAFVGLVAIGVVLASLPRPSARIGAAIALAGALGLAFVGSSAFRERFGGDLFAASGAPIPEREATLTRIREVTIPGGASRLWLSPRGASFAVGLVPPDEHEDETAYLVETAPGRLESLRAGALEYLDDDRILIVEKGESRSVLKALTISDLESAVVVREIPPLAGVDIDADGSGNWRVTGYDWAEGELLLIRGSLDGGALEEVRFPIDDAFPTLVSVNREGFTLLARYEVPELLVPASSPRLVMALDLSEPGGSVMSLGKSALSPQCFRSPLSEPGFYCAATSGGRTALFSLSPGSSSFEPLGFLSGTYYGNEVSGGARLLVNPWNGPPLLVDLARKVAFRADAQGALLAWQGDVLAAARVNVEGDETRVTLYTVGE